jgi:hypothetical protein
MARTLATPSAVQPSHGTTNKQSKKSSSTLEEETARRHVPYCDHQDVDLAQYEIKWFLISKRMIYTNGKRTGRSPHLISMLLETPCGPFDSLMCIIQFEHPAVHAQFSIWAIDAPKAASLFRQ